MAACGWGLGGSCLFPSSRVAVLNSYPSPAAFLSFLFLWYWDLNSGPCPCQVGAGALSYIWPCLCDPQLPCARSLFQSPGPRPGPGAATTPPVFSLDAASGAVAGPSRPPDGSAFSFCCRISRRSS